MPGRYRLTGDGGQGQRERGRVVWNVSSLSFIIIVIIMPTTNGIIICYHSCCHSYQRCCQHIVISIVKNVRIAIVIVLI